MGFGIAALGCGLSSVLLLGLASAGASAVAGALLARRLSAALDALARAARRAAGGEAGALLPSGPGAEVGRLAAALTQMAWAVGSIEGCAKPQPTPVTPDERLPVSSAFLNPSESNDHANARTDPRC